ncbi:helix-turn-helix transcriptional regulator [Vagococcus carniphilus]|uniref:Helix-turn-helix transcriptional regulator n=1 Tax=Vagococcus carniphilus TaxID=218144 RepID=A0AAW8UBR2_9ENTE|nr:helix-turn-helix transcriptional regulator [Vagococcus carniphilus]MDT2834398.1 helix-turn-helix transcriptional regulator [Vagococcus carniphilus]
MTYKVKFNIKVLAEKHNISLRELARLSNIEPSIINKMANNKRNSIYLEHIERIAETLDIKDLSEIIYLEQETDAK